MTKGIATPREEALIVEIQRTIALQKSMEEMILRLRTPILQRVSPSSPRPAPTSQILTRFQVMAEEVGELIHSQGVDETCGTILAVAKEIKPLTTEQYQSSALRDAFERGIKKHKHGAFGHRKSKVNPLAKLKL